MTQLSTFFNNAGTALGGSFYPKNFVFAAFPTFSLAQAAYRALQRAGFQENEMIAVSAPEVLDFFEEHETREGAWDKVVRGLSHFIDTEAKFADRDIELAKAGAAFIAIHCSTEEESAHIGDTVRPFWPVSMQWYRPIGVEELR